MNKGRVIQTQSPRQRAAYPRKQERMVAKLGLSFTLSPLFQCRIGRYMGPNASSIRWGTWQGARWLQDPQMCAGKQEQKREETRKIPVRSWGLCPWLLWSLCFVVLSSNIQPGCREGSLKPRSWLDAHPLKVAPTLLPDQERKEAAELQAEHTAWCT